MYNWYFKDGDSKGNLSIANADLPVYGDVSVVKSVLWTCPETDGETVNRQCSQMKMSHSEKAEVKGAAAGLTRKAMR